MKEESQRTVAGREPVQESRRGLLSGPCVRLRSANLPGREAEGVVSGRSQATGLIMSCRIVPSSGIWGGFPRPGVLGGGVDSTAGELVLEGEERVGLEGG